MVEKHAKVWDSQLQARLFPVWPNMFLKQLWPVAFLSVAPVVSQENLILSPGLTTLSVCPQIHTVILMPMMVTCLSCLFNFPNPMFSGSHVLTQAVPFGLKGLCLHPHTHKSCPPRENSNFTLTN